DPVVVIPVEFSDVNHNAAHNAAYYDTMMNPATGPSVNSFYRENSYGTFGFQATIGGWVRSTRTMAYYGQDGSGVDDATGPIYRLVAEAVRLADSSVNFANFDRNSDGVVDHVVIVHAGGAQEASPNTNLIWSHRWAVIDGDSSLPGDQRLVADGVQIYGYVMISEDSPFGVLAHEFGHDLGLPDLYDTDGPTLGVGVWDVMGSGSWNGNPRGTSPSHFSAWSKIQLGWVSPIDVTAPLLSQTISQVENNSVVYRLTVKDTTNGDEYFLVENRERVGFDAAQPGDGLLIWHVDDSVQNNDNEAHRRVDLVEADEATGDKPDDAGDPWASSALGFGPDTNPNSNGYGNIRTGWKVRNIGAAGAVMTADLSRDVDDDLAVLKVTHPLSVPVGGAVNVAATLRNQGARTQTAVNVVLRVYLDTLTPAAEVNITSGAQTVPTFTNGAFVNLTWMFTAASAGRYLLDARVDLPNDEIPENNERLAHVTARAILLQNDVESGAASWTTPGQAANDPYRWAIVNDGDLSGNGKSHSPSNAWRFGYILTILPNLFPPEYHYLDSPTVAISPGPLYLAYYQVYDLSRTETPTTNETDHAYVEVSADGGPWVRVAHFQGKDLAWRAVSLDLGPFTSGATTVQVRFNSSSAVMPQSGGWWIDDILLTRTPFGRGVAVLPVIADRTIEPGAEAVFTFKVVNVGDFDDEFRFSAALPSGWTAVLVSNSTAVLPVDAARARVAPDAESSLQFRVVAPSGVLRGSVEQIPLTVTSTNDANQTAQFVATARVADPLGLGGIQKYIVWIVVLGIALIVIVILVDHAKSRKFRGHLR
ncbi:MAG TPA: M6 family metalloprotease domain-containing protein, partial [Thermoplasmata archaeon]|nr:M6 family metalloprotease domain-containing protein [Thermoplasmata archaeon]